jgi:hypothetical protein
MVGIKPSATVWPGSGAVSCAQESLRSQPTAYTTQSRGDGVFPELSSGPATFVCQVPAMSAVSK